MRILLDLKIFMRTFRDSQENILTLTIQPH